MTQVMEKGPVVIEATDQNFLEAVVEESKRRPLYLVDLWQPGAGVSSGQDLPEGDSHAQRAATAGSENV